MSRSQKTRLVSLFDTLRSGPYQPPGDGWDDPTHIEKCQLLVDAGFAGKTLPLAAVILAILVDRAPDTVRGVMYAVVSAGWLPDTSHKNYSKIQRLLDVMRKRGLIPFSWIVDNIRSTEKPSSWAGLDKFADASANWYRLDCWSRLTDYVCVIVEKDTVAGRIAPVTRMYDVALHPLRGFSSTSYAYQIGDGWRKIQKPIHAYYIGDHDPSGRDIERSIRQRLAEISGKEFHWQRLAVESTHFQQYKIIALEPKKKDTRYGRFAEQYGERCAEVEAVPADALREMVELAIVSHIPSGEWERLKNIERLERDTWKEFVGKLRGVA